MTRRALGAKCGSLGASGSVGCGAGAGVLHSDDFSSLRKGYWVVFSGQYPDQKAAQDAAQGKGGDAYAREVVPR